MKRYNYSCNDCGPNAENEEPKVKLINHISNVRTGSHEFGRQYIEGRYAGWSLTDHMVFKWHRNGSIAASFNLPVTSISICTKIASS